MSKSAAPFERIPYLVRFREPSAGGRKDVYGSLGDHVAVQAQLMRNDQPSDTVIITIHQIGSQANLPIFTGMAAAGHHVISCANRYISGDFALQTENVLMDLGACIRDAKERLGYSRVVLAGWSGGGSLAAGYQAEAEAPQIKTNAAGEYCALADTELVPADAVMLLAPHRSRHHLITDFLDPSIVNELDPLSRDPELDLFPRGGDRPLPLDREWLLRYRSAQVDRNRRITQWVRGQLALLGDLGTPEGERAFIVHGTMADPRWVDVSIDPNERKPGSYIGDPRQANNGLAALGRYSSLRSWLSQWGIDSAQVDIVESVGRIGKPILLVVNDADDACPTTHTDAIYEAARKDGIVKHHIAGANHYYVGAGQKEQLAQALGIISQWISADFR